MRTTTTVSLRLSLLIAVLAIAPHFVRAQQVERFTAPCGLSADVLVRRAASIFARTGCRVLASDVTLGYITAEFLSHERTILSPTIFHLATDGTRLHITYWREGPIGGPRMVLEPEAETVNPILDAIRALCSSPVEP